MGKSLGIACLLTTVAALTGCATSRGDALMARGAYTEAASAYDAELRASPKNATLERRRTEARAAAVRDKLAQAADMRERGRVDAALAMLREALALESRWAIDPSSQLAAERDAEIVAAEKAIAAYLQPLLAAKTPLAAEQRVAKVLPLLTAPQLSPIAARIQARITAAGQQRCAELSSQSGEQPYLDGLVASYCALFGGATPAARATPDQRSGLRVSGGLAHASPAQQKMVETWLAEAFRQSAWFASEAPAMTPLELTGAYEGELGRRRVTLTAPYREVVRSTIHPNSGGIANILAPPTVETIVERVFQYEADEFEAWYALDVTLTLDLGGETPLVTKVKAKDKKKGYEHDVSFEPADVQPRRANLPTMNVWLQARLNEKLLSMVRKLNGHWAKAFCARSSYSPEEAARCLQGNERRPAAIAALRAVFNADADLLLDELMRRRAVAPKRAGDKKPAMPAVEQTTPADTESI